MTLSQIDGKENPKIQTINFKDFPIKTARFSASGNEFIVGSKFHPHFFVYDMLAGQTVKVHYCKWIIYLFPHLTQAQPNSEIHYLSN